MRYSYLINKRKNINNDNGYTLVELLAIIVVLSLIIGIVILFTNNIITNAKEKSYRVTANNIEQVAFSYAIENDVKYEWIDVDDDNNKEYFCVSVEDLINMGYLKNDVLSSYIDKDITVNKNDYIYLERDKITKSINKNLLVSYYKDKFVNYCNSYNTGVDIEFFEEPTGWAREKKLTIKYKVFNLIDKLSTYEYRYVYKDELNNIVKEIDNKKFDNLIETEVIDNITLNGVVDAYVNIMDSPKKHVIDKIDRNVPSIQLSIDDKNIEESKIVGKEYAKSRSVKISLVDNQSGLKKGSYTIKYDWSLEDKSCDELANSFVLNVNDDNTKIVSKNINISNETGKGKFFVCGENVSDNAMNVANKIESKIDLYLDNIKPVISLGDYTGNSITFKSLTIPLLVNDEDSGVNKESFVAEDIVVLVGNTEVTTGVSLSFVGNNKYNLKIDNSNLNGKIVLKIDNNKILDYATNGNDLVELDTGVTFRNTYLVTFDANGGSGAPENQIKFHDENLTLSSIKPTRTGFSFDGWKDSNGVKYNAGETYSENSDITLVAQWQSSKKYIIKDGVVQSEAGGLKPYNHSFSSIMGEDPLISYGTGYIIMTNNNWRNCTGTVYTKNKINFDGFNYLKFSGDIYTGDAYYGGGIRIHSDLKYGESYLDYGKVKWETAAGSHIHVYDYSVDISDLNSSYYVGFSLLGNNLASRNYIYVLDLWLE